MNAAVIIETRKINLKSVLSKHLPFLPGWESCIVGSEANWGLNRKLTDHHYTLYPETYAPPKFTHVEYNNLLTSVRFWEHFKDYNRVLIFQHDSEILRFGIDEFLEWDYVGAPWLFQHKGGNGGLSLRNPQIMLKCIEKYPYNPSLGNEDIYFSNHIEKVGGRLAPREICSKFSCETIFKLGTFGVHKIDAYLTQSQCKEIRDYHKKNKAEVLNYSEDSNLVRGPA